MCFHVKRTAPSPTVPVKFYVIIFCLAQSSFIYGMLVESMLVESKSKKQLYLGPREFHLNQRNNYILAHANLI